MLEWLKKAKKFAKKNYKFIRNFPKIRQIGYPRVIASGSGRARVAREPIFRVRVASGIKFSGRVVG